MYAQLNLINPNPLSDVTDLTDQERWRAVLSRDAGFDGAFVFAVQTTGVYCRPSCKSRRPNRENVQFFGLPEVAEDAGYRACKRCHPEQASAINPQVETAQAMCQFLREHAEQPNTLETLGARFGYSPSHAQRLFKSVVGISPTEYAQAVRLNRLRDALRRGDDISGAIYDIGYGSPSRVYETAAPRLGMTPGAYKRNGAGATIRYAVVQSPLGLLLVAATDKGVCAVRFGDDEEALERELFDEFRAATIARDEDAHIEWVTAILRYLDGKQPHLDLPLDVQATAFQAMVWGALRDIPFGETRTYAEVAAAIGKPNSVRAVANACGDNPAALVVPCHRVVRADGSLGGYRWGLERKRKLLDAEAQRRRGVA